MRGTQVDTRNRTWYPFDANSWIGIGRSRSRKHERNTFTEGVQREVLGLPPRNILAGRPRDFVQSLDFERRQLVVRLDRVDDGEREEGLDSYLFPINFDAS